MTVTHMEGATHCDDFIDAFNAPKALRWFLLIERLPASTKIVAYEMAGRPKLFADHEGRRVRVVMASRLGDVGITSDLKAEDGYSTRVPVEALSNFSVSP